MDARVAKTRTKVLDAATQLMVEAGAGAVTVEAVVERSGVAKSTIYRHWESRDALLYDVLQSSVAEEWDPRLDLGFADGLRSLVRQHVEFMADPQWESTFVALVGMRTTAPNVATLTAADRERKLVPFAQLLALGKETGWRVDGITATELALALIGPLVMAFLIDETHGSAQFADRLVDRFLASVQPA